MYICNYENKIYNSKVLIMGDAINSLNNRFTVLTSPDMRT